MASCSRNENVVGVIRLCSYPSLNLFRNRIALHFCLIVLEADPRMQSDASSLSAFALCHLYLCYLCRHRIRLYLHPYRSPMSSPSELRKSVRYPLHLPVTIKAGDTEISARSQNISKGGILLSSDLLIGE